MHTSTHSQKPIPSQLLAWLRTLCALAVGAALVLPAFAMSIREMRTLEKTEKLGSTYTDYYLVGVMEGTLATHDQAVRNGATPTICLNGRRLLPSMAKGLFTSELKRNADLYEADMPVELVMLNALGTVYPC